MENIETRRSVNRKVEPTMRNHRRTQSSLRVPDFQLELCEYYKVAKCSRLLVDKTESRKTGYLCARDFPRSRKAHCELFSSIGDKKHRLNSIPRRRNKISETLERSAPDTIREAFKTSKALNASLVTPSATQGKHQNRFQTHTLWKKQQENLQTANAFAQHSYLLVTRTGATAKIRKKKMGEVVSQIKASFPAYNGSKDLTNN